VPVKKKPSATTPPAKLKDLKAKKNPKGGAFDAFLKIDSPKIMIP